MKKVLFIIFYVVLGSACYLEAVPKLVLHFDVNKTITAIDTAKNIKGNKDNQLVFQSFYQLVAFMNQQEIEYSIVLRTFGKDLNAVVSEIEAKTTNVFFTQYPRFLSGELHVEDRVLSSPVEIYAYFSNAGHVAVQDEYSWWASHGKKTSYGKPFYVNLSDEAAMHVFFDDNISTNDKDPSIVASLDAIEGKQLSARQLSEKGLLHEVNPSEAMLNEKYYIEKVKPLIALLQD